MVAVGDGRVLDGATLVIDRRVVSEVREDGSLPTARPSDWRLDADGRLVTPGLVDAWSILPEGRERAAAHLADAVLSGTTSVVAIVPPSLSDDMVGYVERLGLRTVLGVDAGENEEEALDALRRLSSRLAGRGVPLTPAIALAKAAACSDERLAGLIESTCSGRSKLPLLLSAAANEMDLQEVYERFACRPIERLRRAGALGPRTFVGQGNLLDSDEIETLAKTGAWLVACPRSAWRDGYVPPIERVRERGGRVALGTAGEGPGPLAEVAALAVIQRGALSDGGSLGTAALMGGASLVGSLLDIEVGVLAPGALADVVVHRHRPSRPVAGGAWVSSLEGVQGADWVVIGGRVVLREGSLLGVDLSALARVARRR